MMVVSGEYRWLMTVSGDPSMVEFLVLSGSWRQVARQLWERFDQGAAVARRRLGLVRSAVPRTYGHVCHGMPWPTWQRECELSDIGQFHD